MEDLSYDSLLKNILLFSVDYSGMILLQIHHLDRNFLLTFSA